MALSKHKLWKLFDSGFCSDHNPRFSVSYWAIGAMLMRIMQVLDTDFTMEVICGHLDKISKQAQELKQKFIAKQDELMID